MQYWRLAIPQHQEHVTWMRDIMEGRLPLPRAAQALELEFEEIALGRIVMSMQARDWMSNTNTIHGGITSSLLDTVMTLAVMSKLPSEKLSATLNLNVSFIRPLFPTNEQIFGEGTTLHVGSTIATAEGRVHDRHGRLMAYGTASFAIVDPGRLVERLR